MLGVVLLGAFFLQTSQTPASLANAQVLLDQGKLSQAESVVRGYLEGHTDSADAHYLLGYILFKEQNPKASLEQYTEGARYREPSALDLEVIGCDYFLMEDYGTADQWLTKAINRNPGDAVAQYFLGRAKYNLKRFDEAVRAFTECLKLDPQNVKAADNLGLSYDGLGKTRTHWRLTAAPLHWTLPSLALIPDHTSTWGLFLSRTIAPATPSSTSLKRSRLPRQMRAHTANWEKRFCN